jgi:hypothetical protein
MLEAVASWQGVEPGKDGEAAPEITHTIIRRSGMTSSYQAQHPEAMDTFAFLDWLNAASVDELEAFAIGEHVANAKRGKIYFRGRAIARVHQISIEYTFCSIPRMSGTARAVYHKDDQSTVDLMMKNTGLPGRPAAIIYDDNGDCIVGPVVFIKPQGGATIAGNVIEVGINFTIEP